MRSVSLPTFRPKVVLTAGSTVQLIDATQVELLADDQQASGGVKVDYGRLVLTPQATAPTHLRLQVGSRSGVLTFPDAEAIAALDVHLVRVPGTNPETEPAAAVASLYVKSGQVLWQEDRAEQLAGQAPLVVEPGNCLILDAQPLQAPIAAPEFPKWVLADTASPLDRRASSVIEPAIQVGRPVSLGLAELLDHRMQEVQWLAIRCLGQIGNFDPMVAALNDPNRKAAWPAWPLFAEQLKTSLAYGPETAVQVRRALEKQHGEYAAASYRMLWGYTLEGFRSGQAEELVRLPRPRDSRPAGAELLELGEHDGAETLLRSDALDRQTEAIDPKLAGTGRFGRPMGETDGSRAGSVERNRPGGAARRRSTLTSPGWARGELRFLDVFARDRPRHRSRKPTPGWHVASTRLCDVPVRFITPDGRSLLAPLALSRQQAKLGRAG